MSLPLRLAWCAPVVALMLLWPSGVAAQQQPPLRFVGEFDIPDKAIELGGTTVGGLSGLTYDARRGVYYIICDDRGEFGPARFYTARIDIGLDGIRDVQLLGVTLLDSDIATPGIQPYESGESDTEEIVLMPDDTLLISSERDRQNRPWLRRFALDGSLLAELPIPETFQLASMPDGSGRNVQTRGVRPNLGFEGVTLAPDESALYAMNEEALAQDGPIATPAAGTNVRLLRYSVDGSDAVPGRQVVYRTEPIFATPVPPDQFADNGVSAMLFIRHVLPQFDFLVMERSFVTGVGIDVNIFGVRIGTAPDVSTLAALPSPLLSATMEKTLLVNMAALGIAADNLEGLVLGPRLPDGRASLLVIADDNFSETQTNQFLLFEVDAIAGK
ncbi:MAG: esterase-like activity of phytase family protein [Chloroflexota bacterium]|nr:esterase-like activity of phytase family protein [Chloroflexota bacterium]